MLETPAPEWELIGRQDSSNVTCEPRPPNRHPFFQNFRTRCLFHSTLQPSLFAAQFFPLQSVDALTDKSAICLLGTRHHQQRGV